ncbi:LarC family nickel insertion protein [Candidatus Poribacteria bacterium]|nr:LarC family nickel insertion protein [Candidatus Poribacteria bacterium]
MEVLYVDPFAGVSGDMFLGALVDLGVSFDALRETMLSLHLDGFDLKRSATKRHSIAATKVDVIVEDVPHPHRHLAELLEIISNAPLSSWVAETSAAVLRRLAEGESRVHRIAVERVHFHEVGGLDCIADVVGTVAGIELLGVEKVLSAPVAVGSGYQRCEHGVMPVPVPGTLAILDGFPIRRTPFMHEMTTPTGAALIAELAAPVTESLVMTPLAVGYGAGSRDPGEVANLLRLVRAELTPRRTSLGHHEHSHEHEHTETEHP